MKKETQFLCIILLCGLAMTTSGCGIMPSKLVSPTEAENDRLAEEDGPKQKPAEIPTFPQMYPKPAR